MSDFDKEAEREKLREKYGDDEDAATEQMSELLLKGATMTNAHCDTCGDPIFRYDGQEFCPTCQRPVDRGNGAEAGAEEDTGDTDNIEVTTPSEDATVAFGGQSTDDASDGSEPAEPEQAEQPRQDSPAEQSAPAQRRSEGTPTETQAPRDRQPERAPSIDPASTGTGASAGAGEPATGAVAGGPQSAASEHLQNAQRVLAQTVEEYARRARDTDSPRQAREYLEAAREAAETLDETGF